MREFGLYVMNPIISFMGGFLALMLTLKWVWNESLRGDLAFTLLYASIFFIGVAFPIYLGVIYFIDKKFDKFKVLLYPLGCMLIFFIPTLLINLRFGSWNLLSPESMLFHSAFLVSGFIFGMFSWILKEPSFSKIPIPYFMAIGALLIVVWFVYEKKTSYLWPELALEAVDNELHLIPSGGLSGEALYFFIKEPDQFGATIVYEGLLGWKDSYLGFSPMDPNRNYENLNGSQMYGNNLIYGLIKMEEGMKRRILVNGYEAEMIHILLSPDVIKKNQLEDLYVWYFKSETPIEEGEIKLIDDVTQEEIDTLHIK